MRKRKIDSRCLLKRKKVSMKKQISWGLVHFKSNKSLIKLKTFLCTFLYSYGHCTHTSSYLLTKFGSCNPLKCFLIEIRIKFSPFSSNKKWFNHWMAYDTHTHTQLIWIHLKTIRGKIVVELNSNLIDITCTFNGLRSEKRRIVEKKTD